MKTKHKKDLGAIFEFFCWFLALWFAVPAELGRADLAINAPTFPTTNTVRITLSGTQTNKLYQIEYTPALGNNGLPFSTIATGVVGQTVFDFISGTNTANFFRAVETNAPDPLVVATPVFTPGGGSYSTATNVVVTCATPLASIFYTTNGATPTTTDNYIVSGQSIFLNCTTTLKAKAFRSGYSDSGVASATYSINCPPSVYAGTQQVVSASTTTLQGTVIDDGLTGAGTKSTNWSKVSGPGSVTFADATQTNTTVTFGSSGIYILQLAASDGQYSATSRVVIAWNPNISVSIVEPTNGAACIIPTNFVIRASASAGATQIVFYAGSTAIGSATTATASGFYEYEWKTVFAGSYGLTAVIYTGDTNNSGLASAPVNITASWPTNVGQLQLPSPDLRIPVAGNSPIAVTRNYDSRFGTTGAFGYNWKLDYEDIQIITNSISSGWRGTSTFGQYCLKETAYHLITISLSDTEKYYFTPRIVFQRSGGACANVGYPPDKCTYQEYVRVEFSPIPGGFGQLSLTNPPSNIGMYMPNNGWVDDLLLIRSCSPAVYEPSPTNYFFTAPDGTQYQFNSSGKLALKIDRNGNTLAFADDGITYSHPSVSGSTKRVKFTKSSGRITAIYDPLSLDSSGNIIGPAALTYSYDGIGNLTNASRLVNRATTNYEATAYRYEDGTFTHHITRVIDPRGITTISNLFDASGRLSRQYDGAGYYTLYSYDPDGRRQIITDRLGNATSQRYTEAGLLSQLQTPEGSVTSYTYDERGRKTVEVSALGQTNSFGYDSQDREIATTNELGQASQTTYNSFGEPLAGIDKLGSGTTNGYDAKGNLLAVTNGLGIVSRYGYDVAGNRTAETNAFGLAEQAVTLNKYDVFGNLTNVVDALGNATVYTNDANGNRLSQTQQRTTGGAVQTLTTQFGYDAVNRIVQTIGPDGFTNRVGYTPIGNQSETVDKLGRTNRFIYEARGLLATNVFPDGLTEVFFYDAEGRKTNSLDRAGRPTTFTYDRLGRLTQTTFADGAYNQNIYDAVGRFVQQVQQAAKSVLSPTPAPIVTRFGYDAAGRRIAVTNSILQVTRFAYDANGSVTNQVDALNRTNGYLLDRLSRQIQVTFPDGSTERMGYDALGRRLAVTNQAGVVTRLGYDALGRILTVTNAFAATEQMVTRYGYDEVGNQTTQVDALGRVTSFEYDSVGRRVKRILPGLQSEAFGYDAVGNLTRLTNFNGAVITNQYDALNHLTNRTSGSFAASFAFSATGQRTNMTDASGSYSYTYDSRDRMMTSSGPAGSLSYSYDGFGNLSSTTSSHAGGAANTHTYDGLNRLASVGDSGGSTAYGFDAVGNLQSVRYASGLTNNYTYNSLNRLTNVVARSGNGTVASFDYQLGQFGNRTNLIENVNGSSRTFAWAYDQLYRLTNETLSGASPTGTIGYSYDGVGNRTNRTSSVSGISTTNSSYNSNDQLTSDSYDNQGSTTSSAGNSYQYDALARLTNYNNGGAVFTYNGDGIRVKKVVGSTTTLYLVDGRNLTGYAQVLEELTASGGTTNLAKVYTYGLDLISQRNVSTGARSFYGYDGNGNVRYLTSTNATVTDTYVYDAFGSLIASSGTTPNDYRFSGEQYDPNLGFYYLRARYLNPQTGRFWTMDAYEGNQFDPPSLHKYHYCQNDPANRSDPSGNFGWVGIIATITVLVVAIILFSVAYRSRFGQSLRAGFGAVDPNPAEMQKINAGLALIDVDPKVQLLIDHLEGESKDGTPRTSGLVIKIHQVRGGGFHGDIFKSVLYIPRSALEADNTGVTAAIFTFAEFQHDPLGGKLSEAQAQQELDALLSTLRIAHPDWRLPQYKHGP